MSTFVPRNFVPFREALQRLGHLEADELRQALYAGEVRAIVMVPYEAPLPTDWWACDRSWNEAVGSGRGSVSTGPLYFETECRGQILVRADDIDRLLTSRSSKRKETIAGERACQNWLAGLMRAGPPSFPKRFYKEQAKKDYSVSSRGFDRAYRNAAHETGNTAWTSPGPRKR